MKEVFDYIDAHQEQYIQWLQDLCRMPSVAAQNRGMKETADRVMSDLQKNISADVQLVSTDGYPVVFGEVKGSGKKTLSFYNHYDVQPEDPIEMWDEPPFASNIVDGKLIARGSADNKGNLVARIAAVHAYQQVHGELPLSVKFVVEGEEEIGSPNLEGFAEKNKELLKADGCVWEFGYKNADGRQQVSLGVKGMAYVELVSKGANTDLHSANAAVVENPAWRLIWALQSIKDDSNHVNIPGFYEDVVATTDEDDQLIADLIYSEEETKQQLEINKFVGDVTGDQLKEQLIFSPTCNICGIDSGYTGEGAKTVLPSEARVKVDFRLVPNQDPYKVVDQLRKHLDAHGYEDIEIKTMGLEHPARTEPSDPLAKSVISATKEVMEMEPTVMPMSPGTGPMYELCQKLGIPAVSVGVGNFASNNHAPNENILIEDYISGIKVIAQLMEEYAES
ncbi:peptidase M20 [Halalkalibacillus sediminis]|uniref:Peptidase M20 n=1 Tax=Halalkalibacillus sediminis TaxID=2018042 RepID=A0A2I0QU46_9BACI|nr:M20/M25/M40 family metallo-hydrolase [Halalkalibacillus sediminis]PKR77863.1 peptidase M20 [Halalkalibacillus sediminis]